MAARPLLLFGGMSRERLVSVATAQSLVELLDDPICWFWAGDGEVHELDREALRQHARPFENELDPYDDGDVLAPDLPAALDLLEPGKEVIVLALHGGAGENGTVQRWCEERHLWFTGSGSGASGAAFDKECAKTIVGKAGVPVATGITISKGTAERLSGDLAEMLEMWGGIVVKPVEDGSSYGLAVVESAADLASLIDELRSSAGDGRYLAEPYLRGIELSAGVIDRLEKLETLPAIEIAREEGRVFDYRGKYLGEGIEEICPARIGAEDESAVRDLAARAHEALGCFGYSRSDFILTAGGPVYLETNTLPGLTRASLLPRELEAAGIPFRQFVSEQLRLAMTRGAAPVLV